MGLVVTGIQEAIRLIKQHPEDVLQPLASALYQEAELIMTASKELCPVDEGTLRSSGHVNPPITTGTRITVVMGYGGPAADYAIVQHERLDFKHPVGQAKFLEQPLMEAVSGMEDRIVSRAQREL